MDNEENTKELQEDKIVTTAPLSPNNEIASIVSASAPVQTTDIDAYNSPELRVKKKGINKKKLSFIGIAVFVIVGILLFAFLYMLPKQRSADYIEQSQVITDQLSAEMKTLYEENFTEAVKTTTFAESKKLTAGHQTDLQATIDKTKKLEEEFQTLEPTKFDTDAHEKNKKVFEVAKRIQDKMDDSYDLNAQIFSAYGTLPDRIDEYVKLYNSGGSWQAFVDITGRVVDESSETYTKLKAIDKPNDDIAPQLTHRTEYAAYTYETFIKLYNYYYDGEVDKINAEIQAFSKHNETENADINKILKEYVENSTLADDFKEIKELSS